MEKLCVNKRFMRSMETDQIGKWWCLETSQHKCYFNFCLQHSRRETKWPMTNSTPSMMRTEGGWELVHKVTINAMLDSIYHNEPAPNICTTVVHGKTHTFAFSLATFLKIWLICMTYFIGHLYLYRAPAVHQSHSPVLSPSVSQSLSVSL